VTVGSHEPATAIPESVAVIAEGKPLRLVWENMLGGLTFEVGAEPERRFVKWSPKTACIDVGGEIVRLGWAGAHIVVPEVVSTGADDEGAWIVTRALPGDSAVSERWRADPTTAAVAIGRGLRAMHEGLPIEGCPFSWSAEGRVAEAHRRAALGLIDPKDWHKDHEGLDLGAVLAHLSEIPPVDRLVVCHGDACSPNTLIADDGTCSGHTDLGALGVADRWADLAIATWSTVWNYGEGYEGLVLDAYGVEPDPARTAYYRLLWDLSP
jgi:aminoglycoside phosphotransferase